MNERIREFLLRENKSSAQLADEINVQPSGISHILSGRNNPSLDFILKMLEKYEFLSTDWLLFGKGSMYNESASLSLFDNNAINSPSEAQIDNNSLNLKKQADSHSIDNKNVEEKDGVGDNKSKRTAVVEKIVWFYEDNSFEEYFPSR